MPEYNSNKLLTSQESERKVDDIDLMYRPRADKLDKQNVTFYEN